VSVLEDEADVAAGAREAQALLLTLRAWPSTGHELHAVLARAIRYGQRGARLRGFCAVLQQELLRGQEKRPREAADQRKAKWSIERKARGS
jgi:hypothetical protein